MSTETDPRTEAQGIALATTQALADKHTEFEFVVIVLAPDGSAGFTTTLPDDVARKVLRDLSG